MKLRVTYITETLSLICQVPIPALMNLAINTWTRLQTLLLSEKKYYLTLKYSSVRQSFVPFLILLTNMILYSYSLCKAESPVTVAAPAVTTSCFTRMLYLLDINCKNEIQWHCWEYTQEDEEADSNRFVRFWSESVSPSQEFSRLRQQIHISCNCICKQCAISGSDSECWKCEYSSIYSSTKMIHSAALILKECFILNKPWCCKWR